MLSLECRVQVPDSRDVYRAHCLAGQPCSITLDNKWSVAAGLLLVPLRGFLLLGREAGLFLGLFIAALDLRHGGDSWPEAGLHGNGDA